MQITSPDSSLRLIADQRCVIFGLLENFGQYSNSFKLTEPCLTCQQSIIYDALNASPFLDGFGSSNPVPVGSTGRKAEWRQFRHSAQSCAT